MKSENKICQNCKKGFIVEPDDFGFYEKIKVPPPTFCPECRMQRRMTWRNERTLHRNKCAKSGQNVVSCFSKDSLFTGYIYIGPHPSYRGSRMPEKYLNKFKLL